MPIISDRKPVISAARKFLASGRSTTPLAAAMLALRTHYGLNDEGGIWGGSPAAICLGFLNKSSEDDLFPEIAAELAGYVKEPVAQKDSLRSTWSPRMNTLFETGRRERVNGLARVNTADIELAFDDYRAYELGWYDDLSSDDFMLLLGEQTRLYLAHARGEDLDWHEKRLIVIDEIFDAGKWVLDMDTAKPALKEEALPSSLNELMMYVLNRLAEGVDFDDVVEETGITARVSEAIGAAEQRDARLDQGEIHAILCDEAERPGSDLNQLLKQVAGLLEQAGPEVHRSIAAMRTN